MTDATSVTVVDTRKHPRYKVAIPVDCSTRDLFVSNHVCNIGKGGLFIRSDTPLPLNAEVSLVLYLPAPGHRAPVEWSGTSTGYDAQRPRLGHPFRRHAASDRAT